MTEGLICLDFVFLRDYLWTFFSKQFNWVPHFFLKNQNEDFTLNKFMNLDKRHNITWKETEMPFEK